MSFVPFCLFRAQLASGKAAGFKTSIEVTGPGLEHFKPGVCAFPAAADSPAAKNRITIYERLWDGTLSPLHAEDVTLKLLSPTKGSEVGRVAAVTAGDGGAVDTVFEVTDVTETAVDMKVFVRGAESWSWNVTSESAATGAAADGALAEGLEQQVCCRVALAFWYEWVLCLLFSLFL